MRSIATTMLTFVLSAFALAAHAQSLEAVAASDDLVTVSTTGSHVWDVALREYPFFREDQFWLPEGEGLVQEFLPGFMRLRVEQPSGEPLDPFLRNYRHVDASTARYLNFRVRVIGGPAAIPVAAYHRAWNGDVETAVPATLTPTGQWQNFRIDMGTSPDWTGFRRVRIDFAEGEASAAPYAGATIDIEWMAVTDRLLFPGTSENPAEILWRFDHIRDVYTGPLVSEISVPRYENERDRAYARFQLVDAATGTPLGEQRHVTDFSQVTFQKPDQTFAGWAPTGNGQFAEVTEDGLLLSYFNPTPSGFDPFIQSQRILDADSARYVYVRATFTGAPFTFNVSAFSFPVDSGSVASRSGAVANFGGPVTVRIDMDPLGANWTGRRRLRLDIPDGQSSASWTNATTQIHWIALSNDPNFDGSNPSAAQRFWSFEADREFAFTPKESIKGVGVQLIDDAIELGVNEAGANVLIGQLLDFSGNEPKWTWNVDGHDIPLNPSGFTGVDSLVSPLTDADMNVTVIALNAVPATPQPTNPLINPFTDLENHPNRFSSAFNYTDEVGYRYFRAGMEALAARYTREDAAAGQVQRIIIGNELNSHWFWYNLGEVNEDFVIERYSDAMRAADIAFRTTHPQLRAFISMEHHWNSRFGSNPLRAMFGKTFIDKFNDVQKLRGNYPWNLAHHPYPESLFDPEFWLDSSATFSLTTNRVTFKNVEVLPAYLGQESFLHDGQRRRIIFSEQGFHGPDNPAALELQAAAYAYSWIKLSNMPELDAYILHRQVDFEGEGGLDLGLWINDDSAAPANPALPVEKKPSWFVFQAADQPNWETVFDPYLPRTGLASWDEALPKRTGILFAFDEDEEQWDPQNQISGYGASGGFLQLTATGGDPFIVRQDMFLGPDVIQEIVVRMAVSAGPEAQLFWGTSAEPGFSESKSLKFPIIADGAMRNYSLDLSMNPEWDGKLITSLRLDPTRDATGAAVDIDAIVGGRLGEVRIPGVTPDAWMLVGN